jgi:hypothetical protein
MRESVCAVRHPTQFPFIFPPVRVALRTHVTNHQTTFVKSQSSPPITPQSASMSLTPGNLGAAPGGVPNPAPPISQLDANTLRVLGRILHCLHTEVQKQGELLNPAELSSEETDALWSDLKSAGLASLGTLINARLAIGWHIIQKIHHTTGKPVSQSVETNSTTGQDHTDDKLVFPLPAVHHPWGS